jgi:hypothetical protein
MIGLGGLIVLSTSADTWALLVGIDDYRDPRISDLNYTVNDVTYFSEALIETGCVPKSNVYLMTNQSSGANIPTHTNVLFRLENLTTRVKPEDIFIFYFTGHGMMRSSKQYLLAINSDPRSATTLATSAIPLETLLELLRRVNAHQIVIFLDACRNDPEQGKGDADNALTDDFARSVSLKRRSGAGDQSMGTATFFASHVGERAYEWPEKESGVFSFYLVAGLLGKAADSDNQVTIRSLASYVEKEVDRWSQEHLTSGKRQKPWLVSEGPDMVLARFPDKPAPPSSTTLHQQARSVKLKAAAWSILPGGGQFHNSRIGKGVALGGLELAGIAAAIGFHLDYSHAQDKYISASKINDIEIYNHNAGQSYLIRNILFAFSAAVFLYSAYDAYSHAQ